LNWAQTASLRQRGAQKAYDKMLEIQKGRKNKCKE